MSASPRQSARRFEKWIGAAVFALPVLYLATEHSKTVWFWRWDKTWTLLIAATGGCWLAFLLSFSIRLPRFVTNLRRIAVVTSASVLVALLTLEALLHLTDDAKYEEVRDRGRHAYDPDVGYVFKPNFTATIQQREFRTEWRTNAQGVRADRDFGPKPPGVMRLLALGDSFTEGAQVEVDETWPSVLEAVLGAEGHTPRIEAVNAGNPGYGTVHALGWLRKYGAQFEPDLVLLAMTPNDLIENRTPIRAVAGDDGALYQKTTTEGTKRLQAERLKWYSLPGMVRRSQIMHRLQLSAVFRKLRYGMPHPWAFSLEQDELARLVWSEAEQYLTEMRDVVQGMGARFAVVVIPFRYQLDELGEGFDPANYPRRIAEIGARLGFPVRDLIPAFRAAPDPDGLYWNENYHCNAPGYRLIGEQAAEFVKELGFRGN